LAGSLITLGNYQVTSRDGLQPGKYRLRITALQPLSPRQDSDFGFLPAEKL